MTKGKIDKQEFSVNRCFEPKPAMTCKTKLVINVSHLNCSQTNFSIPLTTNRYVSVYNILPDASRPLYVHLDTPHAALYPNGTKTTL